MIVMLLTNKTININNIINSDSGSVKNIFEMYFQKQCLFSKGNAVCIYYTRFFI